MTELTQDSLEYIMMDLSKMIDDPDQRHILKPTQILIHPAAFKMCRRILFPHNILKRRKGARGRAMTLKWRRK